MKLLHLTHSLNPAGGGTTTFVSQLVAQHIKNGDDVELACLDAPDAGWTVSSGATVHALGPGSPGYGYCRHLLPFLRRHGNDYDCIVVHGVWQYHSLAVWQAFRKAHVPYVVFPHGMLDPWFKRAYPLKHIKKLLYFRTFERRVLRDAAAVLFTSGNEKCGAALDFSFHNSRQFVVGSGVLDPPDDALAQREQFLREFPQLAGEDFLLFLSRIHPKKGCDLLLEAVRALPEDRPIHLVMAGEGDEEYMRLLKQKGKDIAAGGIKRVTWTGFLSGTSKWGALRSAAALILPSHQENFGMVVAESLACATPVLISSKVDIWQEVLSDGAALVESDDAQGTCRLLERWLALDSFHRGQLRENARRCFLTRFTMETAFSRYMDVLKLIRGQVD